MNNLIWGGAVNCQPGHRARNFRRRGLCARGIRRQGTCPDQFTVEFDFLSFIFSTFSKILCRHILPAACQFNPSISNQMGCDFACASGFWVFGADFQPERKIIYGFSRKFKKLSQSHCKLRAPSQRPIPRRSIAYRENPLLCKLLPEGESSPASWRAFRSPGILKFGI